MGKRTLGLLDSIISKPALQNTKSDHADILMGEEISVVNVMAGRTISALASLFKHISAL